jgi:hypothetical protein
VAVTLGGLPEIALHRSSTKKITPDRDRIIDGGRLAEYDQNPAKHSHPGQLVHAPPAVTKSTPVIVLAK